MAAKKRKKVAPQLWAARAPGEYSDVALYAKKPKLNGECGECGNKVYWEGDALLQEVCVDGFERLGIKIAPGEAVQLKVTRVQQEE